ncbi:MAG: hypothetical protein AB8F74_11805 [Saprospiraceae bacterium]
MTKNLKITIILLGVFLSVSLSAQHKQSIFDKMSYTQVLDVTITTDLSKLEDKRSEKKHRANLTFTDSDGITYDWAIKLAVRGKFRRMRCTEIPPLKIYFDKDDLREAGLTKFDDLKLVNQCMEDEIVGRELLLKEYLAYELYNELTPESFRVQFMNITYEDSETGERFLRSGFVIEDAAQLRDRISARKVKQERGFEANQFNQEQFRKMALFQYLIGNSDWSATFGRNIKVLEKDDQLIAIPYDFDFSGVVDAPYATPNANYGLTSLQQRIYLGYTDDVSDLSDTVDEFKKKRSALKKVVKGHDLMSRSLRNKAWTYLSSYFSHPDEIKFGVELNQLSTEAADEGGSMMTEK